MRYIELNNELKIKDSNGNIQFHKDKEATRRYFIDFVNQNTVFFHNLEEKLGYLIDNKYYDPDIYAQYTFEEIKSIFKAVYNKKFRFQSFMSAFKYYNNYTLKTDDGSKFLERYEDRIVANALLFGEGDYDRAMAHAIALIEQNYQPATPTFLNAGRLRRGEYVSCFLLDTPDSTEGIMYVAESCAQLSRLGGGVGINLSKLRSAGETIKGIEGAATGPVGIAKILEDIFSQFNQLGQRNGSGVAQMNIFCSDIESFLDTKKINADEKTRLKTLSISVLVPSKFYELAEQDKPFFVFYPHNVYQEYGVYVDEMDMDEWYDKLLANPRIKKKRLDARRMMIKIAQIQQESGYPYIINIDNANKANPLKDVGRIKMSNLCTEIFQIQEISEVKGRSEVSNFGKDVSCNLASLVIKNAMNNGIKESVYLGMDAVNTVAKVTSIRSVQSVKNANDALRSVGLGAMGLHGYLAENRISYESREAKDFANVFFAMVNYYSIERSMQIAIRDRFIFEGFERSEYANGEYFKKYVKNDIFPVTEKVQRLFENIYIPTAQDWANLAKQVAENGLANAYRLAIAPTGNISYVQNSTASVSPITEQIEKRKYADSITHYPMPGMNNENMVYYKEAYDMDMLKYLDLIAVIQQHIDQGISTTLYVNSNETTRDLAKYYLYAHKKGLKSLYYTRTRILNVEDCISCSI